MPYFLHVDQEDTQDYFEKGLLNMSLINEVLVLKARIEIDLSKGIQEKFPIAAHAKLYESVLSDTQKVQKMLDEIEGSPKVDCPDLGTEVTKSGFTFERLQYLGKHCIRIAKPKTHLEWTIGVRYEGDFWEKKNDVTITGFCLVSSPITVKLFAEALEATKHFFPTDQLPYWLLRKHAAKEMDDLGIDRGPRHIIFSYLGWDKGQLEDLSFSKEKPESKAAEKPEKPAAAPPGGLSLS